MTEISSEPSVPQPQSKDQTIEGNLYAKIEYKISLIRSLWEAVQSLKPPRARDSEENINREATLLNSFPGQNLLNNPAIVPLYQRYTELSEIIKKNAPKINVDHFESEELNEEDWDNLEKDATLDEEISKLLENDDVRFQVSLENGIKTALTNRTRIRSLLGSAKGQSLLRMINEIPGMPEPLKQKGAVKKVKILPFSIAILVDNTAFEKYVGNVTFRGLHKGILSFIKARYTNESPPTDFLGMLFGSTKKRGRLKKWPESYKSTILHEDFHAFVEGFGIGNLYSFSSSTNKISNQFGRLERLKKIGASDIIIEHENNLLKNTLSKIPDTGHEELLAELAASERNEYGNIPRRTYAKGLINVRKFLLSIKGVLPELDPVITEALNDLNPTFIRNKLQRFYTEVPPERTNDLNIALALFPPSKWKYIEWLISKWSDNRPSTRQNI